MSKLNKIELAEMLAELRAQLLTAQGEGAGRDLKFEVTEVELEVQIEATKKADGKGGVKFWVYSAEAGVGGSEGMTQRLKLKLRPTGAGGEAPLRIGSSGALPK